MPAGITFHPWNCDFISFNTGISIADKNPCIAAIIMKIFLGMAGRKRTGNRIRNRLTALLDRNFPGYDKMFSDVGGGLPSPCCRHKLSMARLQVTYGSPAVNFQGICMCFFLGDSKTALKRYKWIGGIKWRTKGISDCLSKYRSISMI
jgi:hypothetical protein